MNEFAQKWAAMDSLERRSVKFDMEQQAMARLSVGLRARSTAKQCSAYAKKMVEMAIARARREHGSN